jgi:hypothetical protein
MGPSDAYYSSRGMHVPDTIDGGSLFSGFASYKMTSIKGVSNSSVWIRYTDG